MSFSRYQLSPCTFRNDCCPPWSNRCGAQFPSPVLPQTKAPCCWNKAMSHKDTLPYTCNTGIVVSTYMADYLPPIVMPGYNAKMPAAPFRFQNCGTTLGKGWKSFFMKNRDDLMSRCTVSCNRFTKVAKLSRRDDIERNKFYCCEYNCDYMPWPDVNCRSLNPCSRSIHDNELLTRRPLNTDHCKFIDHVQFQKDVQRHRDFYLDRNDLHYPVAYFGLIGLPHPVKCPGDDRNFKIKRFRDWCDKPGLIGPPFSCYQMPCIQHNLLMEPFVNPKLPRRPFLCEEKKPKDPCDMGLLRV